MKCMLWARSDRCTVSRLTLVKGWNMAEVANYAKLVTLGEPDFIEVKGVTYCGSSGASSLTMQNVPYHEDVCAFGEVRRKYEGGCIDMRQMHAWCHSYDVIVLSSGCAAGWLIGHCFCIMCNKKEGASHNLLAVYQPLFSFSKSETF